MENVDKYDIAIENRKFTARNIPALNYEELQPRYGNNYPRVKICPRQFEYGGYEGRVENWKDFGKWKHQLIADRQEVTPEIIAEQDNIIKDSDTQEEKIDKIYRYVANSMRYVSIQLGIGGIRPFDASEVHKLKYSDCKGLSNYTVSLLDYYGVEALYTVIENDDRYDISFDEDIPDIWQGNHIIACAINDGDTIWLECTSKTVPTGFIGGANHNRKVLLLSEDGGKIVRTERYLDDQNRRELDLELIVDEDLNVEVIYQSDYSNLSASRFYYSKFDTKKELIKSFENEISDDYQTSNYDLEYRSDKVIVEESASLHSIKPLKSMAGYVMLNTKLVSVGRMNKLNEKRVNDIYIKNGNVINVNIDLVIPKGYALVESMQNELEVANAFGRVYYSVTQDDEYTLSIEKIVERYSGTFGNDKVVDYNELADALEKLNTIQIAIKEK